MRLWVWVGSHFQVWDDSEPWSGPRRPLNKGYDRLQVQEYFQVVRIGWTPPRNQVFLQLHISLRMAHPHCVKSRIYPENVYSRRLSLTPPSSPHPSITVSRVLIHVASFDKLKLVDEDTNSVCVCVCVDRA